MREQRNLKNSMYSIEESDAGFIIKRPAVRGVVLSGGGVKGIAYAGMLKEMYQQNMIQDLTHLSGASAGAMSTSFISLGMTLDDFSTITTKLNTNNLINLSFTSGRADGSRFRNVLELIYLYQTKKILTYVVEDSLSSKVRDDYKILKTKVRAYNSILETFNIGNLLDLINFVNVKDNFNALNDAFKRLPTQQKNISGSVIENQRLTFYDLKRLRNVLPEADKNLIKHLSVVTTNKTKCAIEVHNEDTNSNQPIAEKVFQSGAHPLLFSAQKNSDQDYISDGGISDNMPSSILEELGLNKQEILCAKVDSNGAHESRINKAKSHEREQHLWAEKAFDFIFKSLLGGSHKKLALITREKEKVFFNLGNMLYLNSGEIKTTTIAPTEKQISDAVENGEAQTHAFLTERNRVFDNLLTSMLFFGEAQLKLMMSSSVHAASDSPLLKNSAVAQILFFYQHKLVSLLNDNDSEKNLRDQIKHYLENIESTLHCDVFNPEEQAQALALCLKQVDFSSDGKLGHFFVNELKTESDDRHWIIHLLTLLLTPLIWLYSFLVRPTTALDADKTSILKSNDTDIKDLLGNKYRLFKQADKERVEMALFPDSKMYTNISACA